MSALVGALRAMLTLDSTAFVDGAKVAQDTSRRLEARLQRIGGRMQAVGAALTAVGVGIAAAVKGQLNAADDMSKAAQKFGVPIEQLSRLKYAADLSDVSMETLGGSLRVMSRNMVQNADAFAALGVQVRDANGVMRSTEEVFQDVSDVFARMPEGAEKTALAMQLFGRSGTEMLPMLNAGKSGLQEMAAEAAAMGLVFDEKTGEAAEAFNDNLTRLQGAMKGIVVQIAASMAPTLEWLSGVAVDLAMKFQELSPWLQELIGKFALFALTAGPLLIGLGMVVSSLGAVAAALKAVGALFLVNPIVLAGAAIAGVAYLIYSNWDGIVEFFTTLWADVKQVFWDTWESIKGTISNAIDAVMAKFDAMVEKIRLVIDKVREIGRAVTEALATGQQEMNSGAGYGGMAGAGDEFGAGAFGGAVADGFADGVVNGLAERRPDVRNAFGDVTGLAREEFDINSPSRVFATIGGQLMAGLGQGVQDNLALATGPLQQVAEEMRLTAEDFKSAWGNAFTSLVTKTDDWRGALSKLGASIAQTFANNAFQNLWSGSGRGGGLGGLIRGFLGFAKGGVFDHGRVQAFADGGIVDRATAFGMAGGMGIMGEAGPEAIMPLTRGANGKLGVMAHGGARRVEVDLRAFVDDDGKLGVIAYERGREGGAAEAARVRQDVPKIMQTYNQRFG